jgi:hypothetical protein
MRSRRLSAGVLPVLGLVAATIVSAQQEQPRAGRGRGVGQPQGQQQDRTPIPGARGSEPSPLLFHEAWTRAPLTQPMVQENLGNQKLTLHLYGNANEIRKTFHPTDDYTYTGETTTNWAITVSDKASTWDLSGTAKIRLKTQNSGYRFLHVVIKTSDGRYYVSEEGNPESSSWIERDYAFSDLHWRNLMMADSPTNASNRRQPDPKRVPIIPTSKATPDLTNVDEVGFSDLMAGGWIPSTSRVASFDVYGKAVPRK